jgi:hypothetical protein
MDDVRPVVGFEGVYAVSDRGEVTRVRPARGATVGRAKSRAPSKADGYIRITLYDRGRRWDGLLHQIVAAAFLGACPDAHEINHKDGNKARCGVGNLEYVTRPGNIQHAMAHGLMRLCGADNPSSRIDEATALAVLSDHASGLGYKRIGKRHGIRPSHARDIIKGKIWRHLKRPALSEIAS